MRSIEASAKPTSPITRRAASRIWSVRKSRRTCSRVLAGRSSIGLPDCCIGLIVRYGRHYIRARLPAGREEYAMEARPGELNLFDPDSYRLGPPHEYLRRLRHDAPVC